MIAALRSFAWSSVSCLRPAAGVVQQQSVEATKALFQEYLNWSERR
jgi:hypothetical protein